MKSFKQKTEARRRAREEAVLQAQEQARLLKEEKEWLKFEQDQLDQQAFERQEYDNYLSEENAKVNAKEAYLKEQEEHRLFELEEQKALAQKQTKALEQHKKVSKQNQKVTLKEIITGEYDAREELITQRDAELAKEVDRIEVIKEQKELQEVERLEKLREQEVERIEAKQIAESEKIERWAKEEQEDLIESQQIQAEVKSFEQEQLQQRVDATAEKRRLEEIDWEEYESRRLIIEAQDHEQREEVNKVLHEVQQILDSERQDAQQQRLSNIHDYVFKIQSNTNDPWVNRPQPKSVLTWEEWKSTSDNNLLFEQDGRRARLLYEQDNARAQRYYETLQLWPETRLLYQGVKGIDKPLTAVQQLKANFEAIDAKKMVHLDSANTDRIITYTTRSLALDHTQLHAVWGSKIGGGSSVNEDTGRTNIAPNGAILSAPNSASAIDGNLNTYWTISHNSASYDLNTDFVNVNNGGLVEIQYNFETPVVLKKIELFALTRSSMPVAFDVRATSNAFYSTSKPDNEDNRSRRICHVHQTETTGSDTVLQNNDLNVTGEQYTSGSHMGIDLNGSASLDPLRIITLANTSSISSVRFEIGHFATGSHIDINQLKFFVQEGEERPVKDGDPIYKWKNSADAIHPDADWEPINILDKNRSAPFGSPLWYSGSSHQRTGYLGYARDGGTGKTIELGGLWKGIPYAEFHTNAWMPLVAKKEIHDHPEFTHFIVSHGNKRFNVNSCVWSDRGTLTAERYYIYDHAFNGGTFVLISDTHATNGKLKFDLQGGGMSCGFVTESSWPMGGTGSYSDRPLNIYNKQGEQLYHGQTGDDNGVAAGGKADQRDPMQRMARIQVVKFATNQIQDHTASFWLSGGPEFRNHEKEGVDADWLMTGSLAQPSLGSLWARHHTPETTNAQANDLALIEGTAGSNIYEGNFMEMIMYNKALSVSEINTVLTYLSDKWQIPVDTAYEISGSVDGVVQSNPGYNTKDGTNDKFLENAMVASSSIQFERPKTLINSFTAS